MNLIDIYENLESCVCDDIRVLASANVVVSDHAADILRHYEGSAKVSLEDFVRAFSPLDIKTKMMIATFEELSNGEDVITSEILISSLGKDSRLLFQENEMLDLVAFLRLSDLFDDRGELVGIPKAMIEQLHKVNSKLVELNLDVDLTDVREKEMANQIDSLNKAHQKEKSMMFEAAASVEQERDDLYAELSSLRKQLNSKSTVDPEMGVESLKRPTETDVDFSGFNEHDSMETSAFMMVESDNDEIDESLPLSAEIAASEEKETLNESLRSSQESFREPAIVDSEPEADAEQKPIEVGEETEVVYTGINVDSDNCDAAGEMPARESPVSTPVDVWSAAAYNNMPWYFETANRKDAETLLMNQPPGSFIVRKSSRHAGWVVSIAGYNGLFLHYLVQLVKGGYALQFVNNGSVETVPPICKTLIDLIEHFQMTTINENTPILKTEHLDGHDVSM